MKAVDIKRLCEMARGSIGSGDPADFKAEEDFVRQMQKDLLNLQRLADALQAIAMGWT